MGMNLAPTELMAETARTLIEDGNYDDDTDTYRLPVGWSYVGSGAYRTCLLAPDGFVYKVQHSTDNFWQENYDEWTAYQVWANDVVRLTDGKVRLAKPLDFFTDCNVLVMEYEPRAANVTWLGFGWVEHFCSPDIMASINEVMAETDIIDLHGDNVYFNTKAEIVIVDYAC